MLSDLLNKIADTPRESLFLAAMVTVVGALLSSMYFVCSSQVQSAQARHATAKVQQSAVFDCMESDRRASYATCASQVALTYQQEVQTLPHQRGANAAFPVRATYSGYAGTVRNQVSALTPVGYYSR